MNKKNHNTQIINIKLNFFTLIKLTDNQCKLFHNEKYY